MNDQAPSPNMEDPGERPPRITKRRVVVFLYLVTWIGGTVSHWLDLREQHLSPRIDFSLPVVPGLLIVHSDRGVSGRLALVLFYGIRTVTLCETYSWAY
jgi:hypothetical protein